MKKKLYLLMYPVIFLASSCTGIYFNKADREYENLRYFNAIRSYNKALEKRDNLEARIKLSNAYRITNNFLEAEKVYATIIGKPGVPSINEFHYARVLMLNGKYNEAKKFFQNYLQKNPQDTHAKTLCSSCDWIEAIMADSGLYRFNPIEINNTTCAFSQVKYGNGLVYTAALNQQEAPRDPFNGETYFNLYFSNKKEDGKWTDPIALEGDINGMFHEGAACFNRTGTDIIFTRSNYFHNKLKKNAKDESNLKLFQANLSNGKWSNLNELPFNSDDFSVGQPSYAMENNALIFASDMPGGFGGTDLYITYISNGTFSTPKNLGAEINTVGNEMFPFFNDNDSSLYFSSEGHQNIGGLDVFQSHFDGNKFSGPKNMGYPVNSSRDDFSYALSQDMKSGFLSSNRGGKDQIYEFKIEEPVFNLVGLIKMKDGSELPLSEVILEVTDKESGVKRRFTNGLDGSYKIKLLPNAEYRIFAAKENYFASNTIEVSTKGKKKSEDIKADFVLEQIVLNKSIVLKNLYYDLGKWDIKPDAKVILDSVATWLLTNPSITIELSSHTDSRASDKFNMNLSEKRAKSAVQYLISKGVSEKKLVSKGYGETKLLNNCKNSIKCPEEEHALNRRTELKIIKIEVEKTMQITEY